MNKCSVCKQDFSSLRAFDEHRVGFHVFTYAEGLKMAPPREDGRRCLDKHELSANGWWKEIGGQWHLPADWEDESWRWEQDPQEVTLERVHR